MRAPLRNSSPARHKRHTPSRTQRGAAIAVTGVVSAGMVMAGAGPASAAEKPVSQARGWFLSGSALGTNLDNIAELQGAQAKNYGGSTVRDLNPLNLTVLNSINLPIGPINLLAGNGLINLGAVNQAAIARANGSAVGASGAVTNSGAIAVDGSDNVPADNATIDLGGALGGAVLGSLADVDLEVGALSANAKQASDCGRQTGDYQIADLILRLQSPLLAGVLGTVAPQLAGLQGQVDGAIGTLNLVGLVTISNLPNLALDTTLGENGPIGINLTTGTITVDVEALLQSLGLDLNNLPPNTEIIDMILGAIGTGVVDLVTDEVTALAGRITTAFGNVTVTAAGIPIPTATVTGALAPLLATVLGSLTAQNNLLDGPGSDLLDPAFAALDGVLSLIVNAQSRSNGKFTERALVLRVGPNADPLVRLNLASASVGPGDCRDDDNDDDDDDDGPSYGLPHTGTAGTLGLGVAGLAMVMAGAAAAGSGRPSRGRHARS